MHIHGFKLPDLGEGTVESEIVEWRVEPGDQVAIDQSLVDMMTDKASIEITSPVAGTVIELAGKPGDMISVGTVLVTFEVADDTAEGLAPPAPVATALNVEQTARQQPPSATNSAVVLSDHQAESKGNRKVLASPAVRRYAREAGIDLSLIAGNCPDGRISKEALETFIAASERGSANDDRPGLSGITEIPLIGLRRKISEKMSLSHHKIPDFGYVEEIDVTELEALRQHLNAHRSEEQPKLSYIPFLMLALAKAVKAFPQCNAVYDDEREMVRQYDGVHLGIATQTDAGLIVPVVKHVESLGLWQAATEVQRLTAATRNNTATKEELSGATITITSLGALGGIAVRPIINYPEVAIIGINKAEQRAHVRYGQIVSRRMMNVSSSFDHRFVDGFIAAQMIQHFKRLLEHPATIFM